MPVTQAVRDDLRNRLLRRLYAGGLGWVAAVVAAIVLAAGAAGLATSKLAGQGATAGGLVATITRLTVSPNAPPGAVVTLNASEVAADGAHPAGWVQFEAGETDIGAPVAVSSTGIASTTAAILGTLPSAASLTASFSPATTAYLASATTTAAAQVPGSTGSTGGSITITFTVPPNSSGTGAGSGTGTGTGSGTGTGTGSGTGAGAGSGSATGNFTVTVQPGTVTLHNVGQSGVATGILQRVMVTDTRSDAPGWYASGQESNFIGGRDANPRAIPGFALGWVPTGTAAGRAALGPAVEPGKPGLGDAGAVLAAAAAGAGVGTSTLSADLTLAIPASAEASAYVGTLTLTYVDTAPLTPSAAQSLFPAAR